MQYEHAVRACSACGRPSAGPTRSELQPLLYSCSAVTASVDQIAVAAYIQEAHEARQHDAQLILDSVDLVLARGPDVAEKLRK